MQRLQDSVFSIVKTTNLSPAVFNFLQPSDDFGDKTPLGGILKDTKHGWLALGPKFCVIDLRTGLKVAARTFGATLSNNTTVTCVVELPKPLTENSQQLIISLQCDDIGMICVLHINGSQILRCIQSDVVVTEISVCDRIPDGPFTCFDGLVLAGTKRGEIFVFDLNRASLIQALKDISQGYEHLLQNESNPTSLSFLPLNAIQRIEEQRELAIENDHHLAILLNENSMVDGQYIFRNPDGTARMKAKRDHIRVTVLQYIPQLGSMAVGFNFGAFQIWNLMTLDLEFTSQVNVECLPVTHFGFQEPCDDPRAFCYLWVVFSVLDRFDEEEFPLAVMYSLTYQGKRMLSDTKCLYQDFSTAAIRFQLELGTLEESPLLGGKCISCHSYSIKSTLGDDGEDSMLNIIQLVWECWGEDANSPLQYGMLLFDLDQWYKDQMPATYRLESNTFMSATWCTDLAGRGAVTLHARLDPASVCPYSHATRLEEHFYPNSLQYNICLLSTNAVSTLRTVGVQRQVVSALEAGGGGALVRPARLHDAAVRAGLAPHAHALSPRATHTEEDQRRFLLSVALEARLSRFLKRCAHDWATGTHGGVGCTLTFLVDWAWKRAVELKENAKELTAPLFVSSALPDRNVIRCLEHCVQQLTQLTGLMDAILTKCCNLVVPDALSEMEERQVGISCVSLYFRVVQWFLRVGLLPERCDKYTALPYPRGQLTDTYNKRRIKLSRLQDNFNPEDNGTSKSCSLLYIDQLIEQEFGGDKIHQMWLKGGSECDGLYPPPSLYSLLRLYLLPEIAEEHKHSLVLYLLVDYSMIYDDGRYEAVIRSLMQFPTMFGLSNTAIKATQAFWHLDHRDFDFALDQLQCLTGNTLHEWQHNVVLSSLLAQKKTQAALQYLHVRKPAPIQNIKDGDTGNYSYRLNDQDKLEDWQSCCNLYLARGLVYEAMDVIRMCVQNVATSNEKAQVLTFFFKGCRNTGNLSKLLHVTLQPFEEEVFVKYLENCNESQTSDLLIMYYLQQARYLEAERYNNKLKLGRPQRIAEVSGSVESLFSADREGARDALVAVACAALPTVATDVARAATLWTELGTHVNAAKPMSVFIQAKSPKNTFTYKSSFIQDTIENASETWMHKPKMRKGLKRALDIEETPFICTPKMLRNRSTFTEQSDSTPPKRARLNLSGTPRTPKANQSFRVSEKLSTQMEELLDMPEVQSPVLTYRERPETPHSILKIRRNEREDVPSPVDSRYLGDSDDELLETASSHTHYSDTTNKHLRFTIPTASESGSTPSPIAAAHSQGGVTERELSREKEMDTFVSAKEKEMDISSTDSYATTTSHAINENHPFESPPKKLATDANVQSRRLYKDTVRARRSLSISANSSLSEDPNTSIESIADIPITLINPRYSGEKKRTTPTSEDLRKESNFSQEGNKLDSIQGLDRSYFSTRDVERNLQQPNFSVQDIEFKERILHISNRDDTLPESGGKKDSMERLEVPKTPRGRRGIRSMGSESTPLKSRSRSITPERLDSPIATPLRTRITRSRSKTPELSPRSSPLAPIPEQPKQECESEPHAEKTTLSATRQLRSRSRTPERLDKGVSESPKLEVINESPTKSNNDSSSSSPIRRSLRSRSRTPEVEIVPEPNKASPRSLRGRSKTPEKLMSPKKDSVRNKKSLSRIVLEANTFAKTKQTLETLETEISESRTESNIECTPMKTFRQVPSLMDVTLSPIVNKSVLQSASDTSMSETAGKDAKSDNASGLGLKSLPAFTTLHETYIEKSVLRSYKSSVGESSPSVQETSDVRATDKTTDTALKSLPAFTTINETFSKSVLHSYESSVAETSESMQEPVEKTTKQAEQNIPKPFAAFASMIETDFERSVLHSHQSSIAESDASKEVQNSSSLITNDSDVEMKEGTQNEANAVQKEKEQLVEIEREINEIEGNMSNDSEQDGDSDRTVEYPIEEGDSEVESEESDDHVDSSDESSTPSSEEEDENEVISIDDSEDDSDTSDKDTDSNQPNIAEIEVLEKVEQIDEKVELSENIESSSIDPLNQAQVSLMTDDNSAIESDMSINLDYSDEKLELATEDIQVEQAITVQETPKEVVIEVVLENVSSKPEGTAEIPNNSSNSKDVVDASPPQVESKETMLVQVPAIQENDNIEKTSEKEPEPEKMEVLVETPENNDKKLTQIEKETVESNYQDEPNKNTVKPSQALEVEIISQTAVETLSQVEISKPNQFEETIKEVESEKPVLRARKRLKSTSSNKSTKDTELNVPKETSNEPSKEADHKAKESASQSKEIREPRTPVTRKRANSNASAKSKETASETSTKTETAQLDDKKEPEKAQESDEPKTPASRKRTQSNSSKPEEKTPEETPSRHRVKTPTSTEMRKIITRRVSREMAGKLDESNTSLDDFVSLTPKKRATRSRSKAIDDNESVVSGSSVVSNRSKVSDDTEVKPVRKGRKSVLPIKPDLSVIPEVIVEEGKDESSNVIAEYSGSRRLTRSQKAMMSGWLEPASPRMNRRASTASHASRSSLASEVDGEDDPPPFDVQPIDRISLLNKTDFEGPPDVEEAILNDLSPESIASDASKLRRSRLGRAASETKTVPVPKAAKIGRRVASVDVAEMSDLGSPVLSGTDSPARGRRASFNRACEALHTPKGRRTSTDVRKSTESPVASPAASETEAPLTPSRRPRRASTQSNASLTKSETGKRSKKMPILEEEDKETKK